MQQLNVLSVDVTQSTDYKTDTSSPSTKDQSSDERFSAMVDRHLENEKSKINGNKKQESESDGNKTSNNSQENKAEGDQKTTRSHEESECVEVKSKSKPDETARKEKIEADEVGENKLNENLVLQKIFNNSSEENEGTEIKEFSASDKTEQTTQIKPQDSNSELKKSEFFISLLSSAQQILQGKSKTDEPKLDESKQEISANKSIETIVKGSLTEGGKPLVVEDKSAEKISQKTPSELLASIAKNSDSIIGKVKSEENVVNKKVVEDLSLANGNNAAKTERSILEKLGNENTSQESEKTSKLVGTADNKNQQLIKEGANTKISSKAEIDTGIKLNEQLTGNEKTSVNALTSDSVEEKIDISSQEKVTKPPIKIDGNIDTQVNKRAVGTGINSNANKSSEAPAIDVLANASNEERTIKELMGTAEIQSANNQYKSAIPSQSLASQVAEKAAQTGQQTSSNQSEQHKGTNSEEQTAAQADVVSDLAVEALSVQNDKPLVFNQQLNAATTTTHSTDVSSQTTRALDVEDHQGAIEEVSKAIVTENNIQTKNNVAALNETISIFRKDFTEAVKDKIMVIISQKLQQFDIRLDPPELGSVHVRVNLQNEQAVVNFTVQNQQAKEAFEENLSKLKDMLAENGVDVGDANVEQQAQNSGESENDSNFNGQGQNDNEQELESADTVLSANLFKSSSSNVDYYA